MSSESHPVRLTRREFLAGAVTPALAGLTGCSAPGNSAGRRPRLRLSTSSILFKDLPVEQACARIARLGFEAVDIWCAYDQCPHLDDVARRLGPEGLRAVLAEHRLELCAFSVYVGGYAKYAELLGRAGGGVAIQGSASPCPPHELSRRMREFLDRLKPLVELAEKYDSYLAIENHSDALLDSLDSFKAFMDLNSAPRLGIALAPYHLQAAGDSVEEAIRIAGSQLFFFYAWQKAEGTNQLPGHGPTDFAPWLAALAHTDYRGFVNPFMHGHLAPEAMAAALIKSRDYLRGKAAPSWKV